MSAYVCTEHDHILIAIADLQPDPQRPLEAWRLQSVLTAMRNDIPLPGSVAHARCLSSKSFTSLASNLTYRSQRPTISCSLPCRST
jgi:hypothetical protein